MNKNYVPRPDINIWDAENVFYLKSHPSRIAKLLAHYELYRRIVDLPGAIIECGVYKGASFCRFASFRALLENDHSRKLYGFDAFGAFPAKGVAGDSDRKFIERFEAAGGGGISADDLDAALKAKGFSNFELVKGDVMETIPAFIEQAPHLRIALLHLDMDVYEQTRFAIDRFLPHMTPGGLIVFDDYNAVEGATRAADELCRERGLKMKKLPFYNVPSFLEI